MSRRHRIPMGSGPTLYANLQEELVVASTDEEDGTHALVAPRHRLDNDRVRFVYVWYIRGDT